jgi:superfamily II DNA or RNA helicase
MTGLFHAGSFPPPRKFQARALQGIAQGLENEHKNQLVMAPTGSGKTYIGMRIAKKALERGKRVTFVCDRTALIEQSSEAADSYGLTDHGIIQQDHARQDWSKPLQIASVGSLATRGWPETDVLLVDEAHTRHKTWVDFAMNNPARVIGLSATPFTRGLGKIFTNLIAPTTMHQLTVGDDGEAPVLVPMRVLSCTRPNMEGAATKKSGEWTEEAAEERGLVIIGDVVSEWLRHGEGRKTIVFGATIRHCEELCRQFNEVGVLAATYTEKTHSTERPKLLKEFRKPDSLIRVLISVEALAKGFDVRDVGCVVDCRPLRKSLSLAVQMWGRGLRTSPETGKTDCLLLDHSGNITRFAEDYTDIYFNGLPSLDMGEALDRKVRVDGKPENERKGCPACGYKPFRQRCMSCGHEVRAQSLVVHEAGVMQEVVLDKKRLADNERHLWHQLCEFAKTTKWVKNKEGYAKRAFHEICKRFPPYTFESFDRAPAVPVSRDLSARLNGKQKQWIIARRAAERRVGTPA